MLKKFFAKIKELIMKLFSLKDTPHAIAGGVAIGMFMGFTPLFGLKTLLSLGAAYLLRCNPIAAVIAVSLHDVVTPLWPVLLRIEYQIGYFILSNPHVLPPKLGADHLKLSQLFQWSTFAHLGLPLLVGSMFLSAPTSVVTYFITLGIVKRRQRKELAP